MSRAPDDLCKEARAGLQLVVPNHPSPHHRAAILAPLLSYNEENAGPPGLKPVAILLIDATGRTVGGLWGKTSYDWLVIEYLAVPAEARGRYLGTALIQEAEKIARARKCCGIWLDTFEFQARGFYEKLGFVVFGVLQDHPRGSNRFFLSKRMEER